MHVPFLLDCLPEGDVFFLFPDLLRGPLSWFFFGMGVDMVDLRGSTWSSSVVLPSPACFFSSLASGGLPAPPAPPTVETPDELSTGAFWGESNSSNAMLTDAFLLFLDFEGDRAVLAFFLGGCLTGEASDSDASLSRSLAIVLREPVHNKSLTCNFHHEYCMDGTLYMA